MPHAHTMRTARMPPCPPRRRAARHRGLLRFQLGAWTWTYDPTQIPSLRNDKESRARTGVGSPRSIAVARSVVSCQRRDDTKSCHAPLTLFVQTHVTQSRGVGLHALGEIRPQCRAYPCIERHRASMASATDDTNVSDNSLDGWGGRATSATSATCRCAISVRRRPVWSANSISALSRK